MTIDLRQGDCLDVMRTMPDRSVHCCVTSPPYFGLRDYGADGQIGLEATPDAFVAKMVEVFREVRRVLRDDGTCWLNLGDSFASGIKGSGGSGQKSGLRRDGRGEESRINSAAISLSHQRFEPRKLDCGLAPKQLIGIPWRVAFALQADGWYLRSDIIWHKPNPMPESVRDRPTKAHEYLFLLSKGGSRQTLIPFLDVEPETVHLGRNLGAKNPYTQTARLCVELAAALFDVTQQQHDFGLPPFYAEVWKKRPDGSDSDLVSRLPSNHRAAAHAARLLDGNATTKEFLCEIDRLWSDLTEADHLLIRGRLTEGGLTPGVFIDGNGAIAINDAGKVCKVDFSHKRIVVTVPTHCKYFYDADAVREEAIHAGKVVKLGPKSLSKGQAAGRGIKPSGNGLADSVTVAESRNRRSVWTVATRPFKGAHFATFPPMLIEPCILAGTSEAGCCPECGTPWERVRTPSERYAKFLGKGFTDHSADLEQGMMQNRGVNRQNAMLREGITSAEYVTTGFRPACSCDAGDAVPCTVLDPFNGAGTTGVVAKQHGRSYVGIELNPEYLALADTRIEAA